jgi:hypothetical protein
VWPLSRYVWYQQGRGGPDLTPCEECGSRNNILHLFLMSPDTTKQVLGWIVILWRCGLGWSRRCSWEEVEGSWDVEVSAPIWHFERSADLPRNLQSCGVTRKILELVFVFVFVFTCLFFVSVCIIYSNVLNPNSRPEEANRSLTFGQDIPTNPFHLLFPRIRHVKLWFLLLTPWGCFSLISCTSLGSFANSSPPLSSLLIDPHILHNRNHAVLGDLRGLYWPRHNKYPISNLQSRWRARSLASSRVQPDLSSPRVSHVAY